MTSFLNRLGNYAQTEQKEAAMALIDDFYTSDARNKSETFELLLCDQAQHFQNGAQRTATFYKMCVMHILRHYLDTLALNNDLITRKYHQARDAGCRSMMNVWTTAFPHLNLEHSTPPAGYDAPAPQFS
jgi:hypothetical protein